jgi:alpha-mannosidase
VLLTLFHDAITGTHTDPAYAELRGIQDRVEKDLGRLVARAGAALAKTSRPRVKGDWITVFNPGAAPASALVEARRPSATLGQLADEDGAPIPVVETRAGADGAPRLRFVAEGVPPLGCRRYRFIRGKAPAVSTVDIQPDHGRLETIANRRFEVTADKNGIVAIRDRLLGREIAAAGPWRPNEAILERDEGSPWATLSVDRPRTGLAPHTRLVAVDRADRFQRLRFVCEIPYTVDSWGMRIESTVTLSEGIDRVDFHARVRWGNFNRRLRFAMPVPFTGQAVYGIPYGQVRRERYQPAFDKWASAGGDWPAVDWAGVERAATSVALLTKGLPSFEIGPEGDGSAILLSVLRSPTIPTYLHQPWHLVMTDYDGMRDEDWHDFDYALSAYGSAFPASAVVADAESFNAGMTVLSGAVTPPPPPQLVSENVRMGALKPAHDGRGVVLRLWEFRGLGGEATVLLPLGIRHAERCTLLEWEGCELPIREGAVTVSLRPWEITTVRLTKGHGQHAAPRQDDLSARLARLAGSGGQGAQTDVRIERCPDADIGRRRVSGEEMNQPKRKEQER